LKTLSNAEHPRSAKGLLEEGAPVQDTSEQGGRASDIPTQELSKKELLCCMQNRELSWLRFNQRVLEEARDSQIPLFERLFFLHIFTTNLDEFFMVRVGSFQDIARSKKVYTDTKTGMDTAQLLAKIFETVAQLYPLRDSIFSLVSADLARAGFTRRMPCELSEDEETQLSKHYQAEIAPVLAPQVVDKTHPFPHLDNTRLIIALSLEKSLGKHAQKHADNGADKKTEKVFGMIPLPHDVERLFVLKDGSYILLEDILLHYAEKIFKKYGILEKAVISVTRNADLDTVDEHFDVDEDYRAHMTKLLKKRKRLAPVRLEIQGSSCKKLPEYLCKRLNLDAQQVFYSEAPLDLNCFARLQELVKPEDRAQFYFTPFEPVTPVMASSPQGMFERLQKGDVMLFHPYESIQPYLSLIKEASEDKKVLSIQITLYRIANQSRLAEYLIAAAENGKRVVVFIELRARMDEESNIDLAKRLEEAGCAVFYGQLGYKVHAKITHITRRGTGAYEHYVHIGTGNYNETTVKAYTDISFMTMNEDIAKDAVAFFQNMLIGAVEESYPTLMVAPQDFKPSLIEFIRREAALGQEGAITIKANSLTDTDLIRELVKASRGGTQVKLIIRGICCLLPGIKDYTENIHIRSILGRYLEHSRVYRFGAGQDCDLCIGSGDMMTRSTERRVELFAPVTQDDLRARLLELFDVELSNSSKAHILTSSGQYIKTDAEQPKMSSQQFFVEKALR